MRVEGKCVGRRDVVNSSRRERATIYIFHKRISIISLKEHSRPVLKAIFSRDPTLRAHSQHHWRCEKTFIV